MINIFLSKNTIRKNLYNLEFTHTEQVWVGVNESNGNNVDKSRDSFVSPSNVCKPVNRTGVVMVNHL